MKITEASSQRHWDTPSCSPDPRGLSCLQPLQGVTVGTILIFSHPQKAIGKEAARSREVTGTAVHNNIPQGLGCGHRCSLAFHLQQPIEPLTLMCRQHLLKTALSQVKSHSSWVDITCQLHPQNLRSPGVATDRPLWPG